MNGKAMVGTAHDPAELDRTTRERLVCEYPVIVRRRVSWGECDPAQVVYTPRFADYLAAAFAWFAQTVLADHLAPGGKPKFATPIKSLTLEFHHVLRPGELFDMIVEVTAVRTRTFDLQVKATSLDNVPRFSGTLSPILVDRSDFSSVALPAAARRALLEYQTQYRGWSSRNDRPSEQ